MSDVRGVGVRKVRTVLHQQSDSGGHCILLAVRELLPPSPELVGVLDIPRHGHTIFPLRNHVQEATRRPCTSSLLSVTHHPGRGQARTGRILADLFDSGQLPGSSVGIQVVSCYVFKSPSYPSLAGVLSRCTINVATGMPGNRPTSNGPRLHSSKVILLSSHPGSIFGAVRWTAIPNRASLLLPSMLAARANESSTFSAVSPRTKLPGRILNGWSSSSRLSSVTSPMVSGIFGTSLTLIMRPLVPEPLTSEPERATWTVGWRCKSIEAGSSASSDGAGSMMRSPDARASLSSPSESIDTVLLLSFIFCFLHLSLV